MNNPFFDQARDGCKKAEAELGGKFVCEYIGPGEHGGGDEQVQIVQDLVARGDVKGIGVAPANAAAMAVALQAAKDAGIPVLTWDSDVLPENADLRVAYIGTHNYEIGVNLAKLAHGDQARGRHGLHPVGRRRGGQPQRAHAGHPRHARRHDRHHARRASALTGQNGWTEADGCPLYTNDDFPLAVQQFQDFMAANPDLDAFVPTGGFPQFVPDANRAAVEPYKAKIADGSLALVVADTLPVQIDQMKEGLLGRPGRPAARSRWATRSCRPSSRWPMAAPRPTDPTYTGLDVCTPDTADTCIAQ